MTGRAPSGGRPKRQKALWPEYARDAERGTEACDRARLAVVARIDDRGRALRLRQLVPNASDVRRKGRPADRLYRVFVYVGNRRRMHVLDRHQRQRDECGNGSRNADRDPERELPSSSVLVTRFRPPRRRRRAMRGQTHRVVRLRSRQQGGCEQHDIGESERSVRSSLGSAQKPPESPSHSGARRGPINRN